MKISVDTNQRYANMRPHTATHLLHFLIDTTIGGTKQAGSRVGDDELRFDFAAKNALTHQELSFIEQQLNAFIKADYTVTTVELTYNEAIARGAKAFFDEKYGENVRLVSCIGTDLKSLELCGGTHVHSTGQIGAFKIITQESVASGIRRIIAVTGTKVADYGTQRDTELQGISLMLDCQVKQIPEKLEKVMKEYEGLRSKIESKDATYIKNQIHSKLSLGTNVKFDSRNITCISLNEVELLLEDINRKKVYEVSKNVMPSLRHKKDENDIWIIYSEGKYILGGNFLTFNDAKVVQKKIGLKGGGSNDIVQGYDENLGALLGI